MNISRIHLLAFSIFSVAALFTACGGPAGGSLGSSCAIDTADSCDEGLSCTEDEGTATCTISAGQSCEPDDASYPNNGCGPEAVCTSPLETSLPTPGMGGSDAEEDYVCLLSEGAECDPEEPFCEGDLTCAETTAGDFRCFGRVALWGEVTDTSTAEGIEGAHVIALDEEGSAVTDVAVSDELGAYLLDIPVLREEDGTPVEATFTLQGSAQDYQAFPLGARVALPISTSEVEKEGRVYIIHSALTDIGLIPLPDGDRFAVSGGLVGLGTDSDLGGALVVATGDAGSFSAIADLSGNFTIFNVPDGDYVVSVYGSGLQMEPVDVQVDGELVTDVSVAEVDDATTTVTGSIQLVNAPGGAVTSVILVVQDTFDPSVARGEVPRGFRAPKSGPVSIDGEFTIEGVSAGRYVVLAAYENDALVRDPDTNQAGTGFVYIEVGAGEAEYTVDDSFKVTEALATISPGVERPEAVTGKPLLQWADDSSEDYYELRVFDAFGTEVYTALDLPPVSGSKVVEHQYDGPLEPGMYYQFRVSSWRSPGGSPAPISTTEDLRGVFFLPAE